MRLLRYLCFVPANELRDQVTSADATKSELAERTAQVEFLEEECRQLKVAHEATVQNLRASMAQQQSARELLQTQFEQMQVR